MQLVFCQLRIQSPRQVGILFKVQLTQETSCSTYGMLRVPPLVESSASGTLSNVNLLAYSKTSRMLGAVICPHTHTILYCSMDIDQFYGATGLK